MASKEIQRSRNPSNNKVAIFRLARSKGLSLTTIYTLIATLKRSFRTEQADFFFPFHSCERVGLRM
jgi:hypothetical protein